MSQRDSGYARLPDEHYATIEHWPVRALLAHLPSLSKREASGGEQR